MRLHPLGFFLLVVFLTVTIPRLSAQSLDPVNIDSLRQLAFSRTVHDTIRIRALAEIGDEFITEKTDSALWYLQQAYRLAVKSGYKLGEATALNYQARYYQEKNEFFRAMDLYLKALNLAGDFYRADEVELVTYYNLGQLYSKMASRSPSKELNRKRIAYYKKALEKLATIRVFPDRELLTMGVYMELGRAYNRPTPNGVSNYDLDTAEYYFNQAIAISREANIPYFTASTYNDLANLAYVKGDYRRAIDIQRRALKEAEPNNPFRSVLNMTMARCYAMDGRYDSARYFLRAGTGDSRKAPDDYYQVEAEIFSHEGRPRQAIGSWERYLELMQQKGMADGIGLAASNLAHLYEFIGNYKSSLKYQRLAYASDSIQNQDLYLRMQELQSQADLATRQAQIDLLAREGEIKNIALERNATVQLLIGGMLLLTLAGLAVVIVQYRAIRRAKEAQLHAFREVDQVKSQFFANISHEFRTPLTLLLAPLEKRLATESLSGPDRREFSVMHRNASAVLNLVNELLELSRLESGTLSIHPSSQSLSEITISVAGQFTSIAESKRIRFMTDIEPGVIAWVDKERFEKLITNLVANAFKFTKEEGSIAIKLRRHERSPEFIDGFIEMSVIDNGIGIAPAHQQNVFDRFYQVDGSSTRAHQGMGIGLAMCREIVQLHGGTISVESEFGKGSSFIVQLPLRSHQPGATPVAENPHSAAVFLDAGYAIEPDERDQETEPSPECILLIEDHADLRDYLRRQLGSSFTIVTAVDGDEGLQKAREILPAVVITDFMMPGRNGVEVCNALKNDPLTSHIPVILLTAKADVESRLQALGKGADDYITKPFRHEELLVRVKNIIQNRKLLQERFSRTLELKPSEIKVTSLEEAFIKNVMSVVERHIEDTSFSVTVFAREVGMSQAQLYRKLQALTTFTPNDFIRHIRLLRAMDMLKQKAGNVADVAYKVGFTNLSYFSKVYKEKFGMNPSEQLKA